MFRRDLSLNSIKVQTAYNAAMISANIMTNQSDKQPVPLEAIFKRLKL